MKKRIVLVSILLSILFIGCVTLREPSVIKNGNIENFKYAIINSTDSLTSGTGGTINGYYYSESKTVNPRDIISGYLIKKGFVVLTESDNDLLDKTFIVNYGESGRREVFWGYTTEVTIQFINANYDGVTKIV